MVAVTKIQFCDYPHMTQWFKGGLYNGKWIFILHCDVIQGPVINLTPGRTLKPGHGKLAALVINQEV